MSSKRILAACLLFFLAAPLAVGRDAKEPDQNHYVNSADPHADDSGPGSIDRPWKSLAAVNSHTFKPGDSVYFARGSSYAGGVEIRNSGLPGKPITFGAYGSGEAPRFTNPSYGVRNGNMIQ